MPINRFGTAARAAGPVPLMLGAALLLAVAPSARAALVEVAVTGVGDARGHVHVDLCTRDTWLKENCPYEGSAPASVGATVVKIAGVPPGEYAAQVFHDKNDTGDLDRNVLGIPTEPIGFSNDAPLHIRGPRFSDAAFSVERGVERITLKLRDLLHPSR
ncbi:MAG: DUF2141 domain-containing protein [Caulobacteraceae bacterium]